MAGFSSSNYAGLSSIWLNPANFLDSKYIQDYHISGFHLFLENNCFYLPKQDYRFSRFFNNKAEYPTYPVSYKPTEERFYKDYYNPEDKSAFLNMKYQGLGYIFRFKRSSFGLAYNLRFLLDCEKVPYHVMKTFIEGVDFVPLHQINFNSKPYRAGILGFSEIALNYGFRLFNQGLVKTGIGINLKFLSSFAGAYIRSKTFNYVIPNDNLLRVFNLTGDYGYSFPVDRYKYRIDATEIFSRGIGGAIDIGFTYIKSGPTVFMGGSNLNFNDKSRDYRYKLGFSLIDIGFIKLNGQGHVFSFDQDTAYWLNIDSFKGKSLIHIDTNISIQFLGSPYASETGDKFNMLLPFSAVLQADINMAENFFINATLIYGFKFNQPSIRHPLVLTLSPRYDRKEFGIFIPITFYDLSKVRLGFGLRIFNLFYAGSDNLSGLFHFKDFTGMDLYFGFKWGIIPKIGKFHRKGQIFKPNKCYKFR